MGNLPVGGAGALTAAPVAVGAGGAIVIPYVFQCGTPADAHSISIALRGLYGNPAGGGGAAVAVSLGVFRTTPAHALYFM